MPVTANVPPVTTNSWTEVSPERETVKPPEATERVSIIEAGTFTGLVSVNEQLVANTTLSLVATAASKLARVQSVMVVVGVAPAGAVTPATPATRAATPMPARRGKRTAL